MSKFKVGDIVRRKKDYAIKKSPSIALNGCPARIRLIEVFKGKTYLLLDDGLGAEWNSEYYELVEAHQETPTLSVEKALAFLMQEGYTVSISKN